MKRLGLREILRVGELPLVRNARRKQALLCDAEAAREDGPPRFFS